MKKAIRFVIALFALMLLSIPVAVAGAQNTRSITVTETQINDSYRVTNPFRVRISNVSVDLQVNQVVISSTHTTRRQSYDVVTTLTPNVSNGRLTWTVASVTANGQPASQEIVAQVNTSIATSWLNFWRSQAGTGQIQSVSITDNDITITFAGR
jgi:hypothetical protein